MKNPPLHPASYSTLVFDCDGVLLDSNKVKTQPSMRRLFPMALQPLRLWLIITLRMAAFLVIKSFLIF